MKHHDTGADKSINTPYHACHLVVTSLPFDRFMPDGDTGLMKGKILIVDDEAPIREMLGYTLMKAGYSLHEAADAEQARPLLAAEKPDLVLLDWMLPGMNGVDYARCIRDDPDTKDIPIIMLTARGEALDKVRALDTGADDYITKPFSTEELLARIRALMRRANSQDANVVISVDGLTLDPETFRITIDDQTVEVSPTEFRLLHFFISHPERVYTRSQILDQVWGQNVYVEERTIDVHIRRLRKTLEPSGYARFIQTVRSVGYRFSSK